MFSRQITQEGMAMMMTDARPQFVSGGRTLRMALLLPAAALIFLGSVFQLGMLGYGQLNPHNLWPAFLVIQSAWNLLTGHCSASEVASAVLQFWPLVLVTAGLGILLTLKPSKRSAARRGNREGA
jgi:hypothetical protein